MLKPEKFADKTARERGAAVSSRPFGAKNGKNGVFLQTADSQRFAILSVFCRKLGLPKVEVWVGVSGALGRPKRC